MSLNYNFEWTKFDLEKSRVFLTNSNGDVLIGTYLDLESNIENYFLKNCALKVFAGKLMEVQYDYEIDLAADTLRLSQTLSLYRGRKVNKIVRVISLLPERFYASLK